MYEIVAYKVWKCKFCTQTTMDSHAMWLHLIDKHGKHSVFNNNEWMGTEPVKKENEVPTEVVI